MTTLYTPDLDAEAKAISAAVFATIGGLTRWHVLGGCRRRECVDARTVIAYILHRHGEHRISAIGSWMNRDHTSVSYIVSKAPHRLAYYPKLHAAYLAGCAAAGHEPYPVRGAGLKMELAEPVRLKAGAGEYVRPVWYTREERRLKAALMRTPIGTGVAVPAI